METSKQSKATRVTGYVMHWIVIIFMLFDSIIKFFKPEPVVQSTVNELGYQYHHINTLGILGTVFTVLFIIPRTRILGAVLLTAQFGGAIASHLRVGNPLFTHTLFPIYIAILMWGSIWLRNDKIQSILPLLKT